MRSPARRAAAAVVIVALALLDSNAALAAPASEGAVQGPALPSVEDEPGEGSLPDVDADPASSSPPGEARGEVVGEPGVSPSDSPPPEPPPPSMQEPELVRVAVGFSSELDGNKQERALLDTLERSVAASPAPRADLRRLRVGAAAPREICREGRDDLVITIGQVPDLDELVLLTYDCRIDEELGVRRAAAAEDADLLGVLWDEHRDRLDKGARERKRARISPKVRTGLIAGAAVAVLGVAVGLLIAGAVRRDTVVLVVAP
ncbi:MAG: hypothetical protein R6X02_18135 [Enhygromyxa sp.]